jgi:integrase/recombinase XerC
MTVSARKLEDTFRIVGDWGDAASANAFLGHLDSRAFSPSTVRSYAFDIVNFARFLLARGSTLVEVSPMIVFEWIDWQGVRSHGASDRAEEPRGAVRTAAAATANRRVAAVRALFEYLVMAGTCPSNPVPSPRRRSIPGASTRGLLGHLGAGRSRGGDGWCVSPRCCRNRCP